MTLTVEQRLRLLSDDFRNIEKQMHECEHLKTVLEGKLMHVQSDLVQLRVRLDEVRQQHEDDHGDEAEKAARPADNPEA